MIDILWNIEYFSSEFFDTENLLVKTKNKKGGWTMALIFIVTTIICAAGWVVTRVSLITVLWYMNERKYPFPNDAEMKKGTKYAIKHFLKK